MRSVVFARHFDLLAELSRLDKASMAAEAETLLQGTGWLPPLLAVATAALAGVGSGLAGPSRDMLIKQAAPPGATGRVYGMVYSGLDLGFAMAAPVFGALLDHGAPSAVFYGSALALAVGVASAAVVGVGIQRQRASQPAASAATA